jgi:hypothetical protein
MHDQRVEPGPILGREDPRHRQIGSGIAAQPIDRLGRKGDQLTLAQQSCGPRQPAGIRRQKRGCL